MRSKAEHPARRADAAVPWLRGGAWVALACLAAIPYLGSLRNPLLHDDRTLLDNPWLRDEAGLLGPFTHEFWHGSRHSGLGLYRPITVLTLEANLRAAPGRAGFHGVNVALHAAVTLLVALLLGTVLERLGGGRDGPARRGPLPAAAWAGAALFAVHPLGSEAVLLAVGRAEMLAALFGIAAFLLFLRGEHAPRIEAIPLAASLVLLLLALGSKESAAAWIPVGVAWVLLARWEGRPAGRARVAFGLGSLAVLAVFLAARGAVVGWSGPPVPFVDNPLGPVGAADRMANAVILGLRYVAVMIWPARLSLDHGFAEIQAVGLAAAAPAALAIVGAWIAGFVLLRRISTAAAFLWVFVPAAFVVTGNLAFPIGTAFAERLAYLPLAGFCGLAALLVSRVAAPRWAKASVLGLALVIGAGRTAVRGRDFGSLVALHEATASASPRSVKALANLGRTRLEIQKRPRDAADLLERAVALYPDYPQALRLLAEAYAALGDGARSDALARRAEAAESLLRRSGS